MRKPIQIQVVVMEDDFGTPGGEVGRWTITTALCDDGTVWRIGHGDVWEVMPPIPQVSIDR